jgi:hypothetical protein
VLNDLTESDILVVMLLTVWSLVCLAAVGFRFGF